jgi:hypothetical protein
MCVDPKARRSGVGTRFYEARKQLVRERSLKPLLTGGRIPGYAQVSTSMTPQEYVGAVVAGRRKDPTLSFQLANGLVVLDVVPEYLKDRDSHDFATLLEWLNPEYLTSLGLQSGSATEEWEGVSVEEFPERARPARVRIAAMQYPAASHWTLRGFRHPSGILRSQRSGISKPFRCVS